VAEAAAGLPPVGPSARLLTGATAALAAFVPLVAIAWVLAVPQHLGLLVYPEQLAAVMLGAATAVVFFRRPASGSGGALANALDIGLGLASLWLGLHLFVRFPVLSEGSFLHPTEALIVGIAITLLSLEGLRRIVGWSLNWIFIALLIYALFGNLVPGPLQGRPQPLDDLLRFLGTDSTATLGQSLQVACSIVVVFVLFGGLLVSAGGGLFFTRLAMSVAGGGHGNTAKVAVLASALFGSVSGSAVSSVMSTGVVTIPLMKRAGIPPATAGAIEAVASTGGQLSPPVMGAAAFLMAEFLRLPYRDILIAATIPTLLYYVSVYAQIDLMARKLRLPTFVEEGAPKLSRTLRDGWLLAISFAVLLGGIFIYNMAAETAVVWACLALVVLAALFGRGETRMTPARFGRAFVETGMSICDVVLVCAVAGMIIGLLTTTGLGFALSLFLLQFGQASLFLLLVITALVALVLGLGLPTTGVYLLLAALAAPALVQLGTNPLAAHMFVFYYGMLSMITPPIALASFAAASLAGASQTETSWQSFRFGWIAYLLPFIFIYQPAVLMQGSVGEVLGVTAAALLAIPLITAGLVGHGLAPLSAPKRLAAVAVGLVVLVPPHLLWGGLATEVAAFLLGAALIALHARAHRDASPSLPSREKILPG